MHAKKQRRNGGPERSVCDKKNMKNETLCAVGSKRKSESGFYKRDAIGCMHAKK